MYPEATPPKSKDAEYLSIEESVGEIESRYQWLIEHVPIILYTVGMNKRQTTFQVGRQCEELLGYPQEEWDRDPQLWFKLLHPEDRERVLSDFLSRSHSRGEAFSSEYRLVTKNGQIIWFRDEGTLVRDENGQPLVTKGLMLVITDRKQPEQEILWRQRIDDLEFKARNFEEVNNALRELVKRRDEDKTAWEEKVLLNVRELVLPYLEKLKQGDLEPKLKTCVEVVESNLNGIVSPFTSRLSSSLLNLTPTEIRVANLVKEGRSTKEIADLFNLSHRTIDAHRDNIRKKLGIKNRRANLRTHLSYMQ